MRKPKLLPTLAMLLCPVLMTACAGSRNVGEAVVAQCPTPPPIPAPLREVPPEAQVDYLTELQSVLQSLAQAQIP